MFNYFFGKQTSLQDLSALIQKLQTISDKMMARSQGATNLGTALYALVQSEAPSYAVYFERVKEIYENLAMNYKIAANEQLRAIEDLNDIQIRYPIYQKIEQEREEMKKAYNEVNQAYKAAKAEYKTKETQETLAKVRTARIERAKFAAKLLEKTKEYMAYRQRFTQFVNNRSLSAWTLFSKSIERTASDEASLMSKLSEYCKSIRDNVDNPRAIIEMIENTKNNMLLIDYTDDENALQNSLTAAFPFTIQNEIPNDAILND